MTDSDVEVTIVEVGKLRTGMCSGILGRTKLELYGGISLNRGSVGVRAASLTCAGFILVVSSTICRAT